LRLRIGHRLSRQLGAGERRLQFVGQQLVDPLVLEGGELPGRDRQEGAGEMAM